MYNYHADDFEVNGNRACRQRRLVVIHKMNSQEQHSYEENVRTGHKRQHTCITTGGNSWEDNGLRSHTEESGRQLSETIEKQDQTLST